MVKILLVRMTALGDVVHAFPAFAHLRNTLPSAHIGWAIDKRYAKLLKNLEGLDAIHEIDRSQGFLNALKSARKISATQYDYAIDFQGLLKSAVVSKLSGAKQRIGFGKKNTREGAQLFYNQTYHDWPEKTNITDLNTGLVNTLLEIIQKDSSQTMGPINFVSSDDKAIINQRIEAQIGHSPFAVLNPGGAWHTKLWPAKNYAEISIHLINKYQTKIILTCFGPEKTLGAEILTNIPEQQRSSLILMDDLSFTQQAYLGSKALICLGPDTGPMHLMQAAGGLVLYLFGASDGWRNCPTGTNSHYFQSPLDCKPCWKKHCPKFESTKCMEAITSDLLSQKIDKLLS